MGASPAGCCHWEGTDPFNPFQHTLLCPLLSHFPFPAAFSGFPSGRLLQLITSRGNCQNSGGKEGKQHRVLRGESERKPDASEAGNPGRKSGKLQTTSASELSQSEREGGAGSYKTSRARILPAETEGLISP